MKVWRKIPEWFNLKNYEIFESFDLKDWACEIQTRILHGQIDTWNDKAHAKAEMDKMFKRIKKNGLACEGNARSESHPLLRSIEGTYYEGPVSVKSISEREAYNFFLYSEKKEQIERDYIEFESIFNPNNFQENINARKEFLKKYSYPIHNLANDSYEKYICVDISASDEQIISDFKAWFKNIRETEQIDSRKKEINKSELRDWHNSKVVPFWDLITIAKFENATVPYHILGKALFPDDIEVDITERVRKVTKKKSETVFSTATFYALNSQLEKQE